MQSINKDKLYSIIWEWIRELQAKFRHDEIVVTRASLLSLYEFVKDYDPKLVAQALKELLTEDRVITNLNDENISIANAFILPKNFNN